jgi:RNA polymerase sigma-70 factor (ECF subfamily)
MVKRPTTMGSVTRTVRNRFGTCPTLAAGLDERHRVGLERNSADALNGTTENEPYMRMDVDDPTRLESQDAIERVWTTQRAKMWRSVTAWSGDAELAADAVAEAFSQALGRGSAVEAPDRWIWKAAFRIAAGELARRRREPLAVEEAAAELPESVVDLVAALRTLPSQQRMAAVLRLYADLPTARVATIMGCTPTTVRVHLVQARRRLRTVLEDTDE